MTAPDVPTVRILTLNLDVVPTYLPGRLAALKEEIENLAPDVVCLQEVLHYDDGRSAAEELAAACGLPVVAAAAHDPHPDGFVNGVAVLSKLPATSPHVVDLSTYLREPGIRSGFDYQMRAVAVGLTTPSGRPLLVSTAHLTWGALLEHARLDEVTALDDWLEGLAAERPETITVLTGDFNTIPDGPTVRYLTGRHLHHGRTSFWVDAWEHAGVGGPGYTSDPHNPWTAQKAARVGIARPEWLPARRIDYVMVRGWAYGRPGCPVSTKVVCAEPAGPAQLVPSDHYGVIADLWDPPAT